MKKFKNWLQLRECDISAYDPDEVKMGLEVEKEHDGKMGKDVDIVRSKSDLLKIVIAHLREHPKYYSRLKKIEED